LDQPTQVLTPLGAPPIQYGYTGGQLSSITDRLGRVTALTSDAVGRPLSQTDPAGRTASYSYNVLNQLVAVGDATGGVTRFTYDPNGNLLSVKDARGNTTSYLYDTMDRLERRTDPPGETGNLPVRRQRQPHPAHRSQEPEHDLQLRWPEPADRDHRPGLHDDADLGRRQPAHAARRLRRRDHRSCLRRAGPPDDADDRARRRRYDNPGTPADRGYDTLRRRLWMEVPGQARVLYTWDPASRLTQVQQGSQVAAFSYDDANRRTLLALPNGTSTEYQYDLASQLTALI
jgi:YD repeat-containing protein